jgi:hypothetical protein
MAVLIVTGEHIQCCPLLTDCHVQKKGNSCLRKSRGDVCGNTLHQKKHEVGTLHGSVCCQVPCLLLCSLQPMHVSCCWGAKCYCWCTEVMLTLHDWDISNMCRSVPSVISSVSSQVFLFFPSTLPKQDLPEIWILNLQVGSCVAVWEWLYRGADKSLARPTSHCILFGWWEYFVWC